MFKLFFCSFSFFTYFNTETRTWLAGSARESGSIDENFPTKYSIGFPDGGSPRKLQVIPLVESARERVISAAAVEPIRPGIRVIIRRGWYREEHKASHG